MDPAELNPIPPAPAFEGAITFLYYKDLPTVARFYEEVLGLQLVIDQGWAKIYRAAGVAHLGLVDETRGYHRASPIKPVEITLLVDDVDAWYGRIRAMGVPTLSEPRTLDQIGVRMFLLQDPEGYVIEIQKFL
ncbi:MAG TPA: VOC family protein [Chloroflexi bacterium]|nr:VOC family protein [Chloroflexota bacterium]HPO57980.1 VOC family protein [Anaerolineaceae bacterium]